jgi:hypothetical protein
VSIKGGKKVKKAIKAINIIENKLSYVKALLENTTSEDKKTLNTNQYSSNLGYIQALYEVGLISNTEYEAFKRKTTDIYICFMKKEENK